MTNEGDINVSSTTNVRQDGGKKHRKGRKHLKSNEKLLLDPKPSEASTSHALSTTEASDNERDEEPINVTSRVEWIARVDTARQDVKILGKRLNKVDDKFKTLKDFTLEEKDNIRKELEAHRHA
uniref:Uncharacterized protein n=1 Tax=Solanum tuberosum TaxID=4113 RepID=M1DG19_SOLTU